MLVIASIEGGLGNQMFQYAAARSLSLTLGATLVLDVVNMHPRVDQPAHDRFSLHHFPVAGRSLTAPRMITDKFYGLNRRLGAPLPLPEIINDNFIYDPRFHAINHSCWLRGVWRSQKYFEACSDIIRAEFDLSAFAARSPILNQIDNETISVHVRRGDFAKYPSLHPIISTEYVYRALRLFPGCRVLVFSDDPSWCRHTFTGAQFLFSEGNPAIVDMALMSACSHNIISNSTFGWWAAWLNKNPLKKVVAPAKWFGSDNAERENQEFLPPGWLRL
jgi:hypothetical protein